MDALIKQLECEEKILKHKLDTIQTQILELKARKTLPDIVGKYIKLKNPTGIDTVYMKVVKTFKKNDIVKVFGPAIIVVRMAIKTSYTFTTNAEYPLNEDDYQLLDKNDFMKIIDNANKIFSN